jgi:hypothetical protein
VGGRVAKRSVREGREGREEVLEPAVEEDESVAEVEARKGRERLSSSRKGRERRRRETDKMFHANLLPLNSYLMRFNNSILGLTLLSLCLLERRRRGGKTVVEEQEGRRR